MIPVRFPHMRGEPLVWLPEETAACCTQGYENIDDGTGAITTSEVGEGDVAALSTYPVGESVYIQSDDPDDVLDDSTDETEAQTRIWWLAQIVTP